MLGCILPIITHLLPIKAGEGGALSSPLFSAKQGNRCTHGHSLVSGSAGVQTQAGCGFNHRGSWLFWQGREGIPNTEVRTSAVLDPKDSKQGLGQPAILECRFNFLHEVSLLEPNSPPSLSQWSSRNCCHVSSTSRILSCQGHWVGPAAAEPGNSEPGLGFPSLLLAEKGGKWLLAPGMMQGHSCPYLISGLGHNQTPPAGTSTPPPPQPRARPHPSFLTPWTYLKHLAGAFASTQQ